MSYNNLYIADDLIFHSFSGYKDIADDLIFHSFSGYKDIADDLIFHSADVNKRDNKGWVIISHFLTFFSSFRDIMMLLNFCLCYWQDNLLY